MDPYIGEIRIVGFNFAPRGWAFCDGSILSIAQNTALFSLLGTTYGGNGQTTFALPNLQGRAAMHPGTGPGLTPRVLGEQTGSSTVTLISNEMPIHSHQALASGNDADASSPIGNAWATAGLVQYRADSNTVMSPGALPSVGGNQAHNNLQPYLVLNFVIALQGIFPPRG